MLTPRSDDPNRAKELKRREERPDTFGAGHEEAIRQQIAAQEDALAKLASAAKSDK